MGGAGKHIQQARWRALPLEALAGAGELQGLAALEECTDYELGGAGARAKKNPKKRKSKPVTLKEQEPSPKKQKLTTGFVVESCKGTKPSTGTGVQSPQKQKEKNRRKNDKKDRQKKQNEDRQKRNFNKKQDPASEVQTEAGESKMLEEMSAWSHFQMPEEILRALSEQGFAKPTKIQELCLPPAMLGRRDILGAAETGSGKTLAFGIPILAGIMKLKEKQLAGQDVYELQYKKTSVKKITKEPENEVIKKIKYNNSKKNNSKRILSKDDESDSDESSSDEDAKEENANSDNESDEIDEGIESQEVSDDNQDSTAADDAQSDSDDYIHLSEMYDSEDLADSTNDEKDNSEETFDEMNGDENYSDEDVDADHVGEGMGCVKVIEDVEMPSHVVTKTGKPLYALVVTPTRELAMQVTRHLVAAAKYTGIRVAVLVGGMAQVKQERLLAQGPEIVVCTPGRLWELMQQGNAHLQQVDNIKFLAIDETDRMLEANHFEELHPLLERINSDERRRAARQNFVFSATLTMVHDLPAHLKGKKVTKRGKIINRKVQKMTPQQKTKKLINMLGMTDPKIIDITASKGTAETLTECRITCALEQKDYYLYYVLRRHPGRTIVFCNSIGCVKRLAQLFGFLKCHPLPLHAGMPQRQRLKNLERFREDPHGVLVATDVAARGLDIPDVDHVIHYQVPRTAENYVHRSGRTARANKEGLTILMMEPGEAFLYSKLCRTLNKTEELQPFPVPGHVLLSMKECVTLARDLERMALASKRRAQEAGWLDRVARDCDIVVDEDFVPMKKKIADMDNSVATPKQLQLKRKQLDAMLSKPVFPKGFSYKYPSLNASDALAPKVEENALQAMKRVLATGELKKEKRTSKNAPLLRLEKEFGPKLDGNKVKNVPKDGKVEKKKKKKFYKV